MRTFLAAITTLVLVGCGGSDTGTDSSTSGPGTVTVALDGMIGVKDKILLATLVPTADPSNPVAGLCVAITSSPFSMSEVMRAPKPGGNNPCDLEPDAKMLEPGSYHLIIGIYVGGSQTPERCSNMDVVVNGETEVTAPLPGAC